MSDDGLKLALDFARAVSNVLPVDEDADRRWARAIIESRAKRSYLGRKLLARKRP